jgi:hypothetical protein
VQPRSHGADGAAERVCRVGVAQLLQIAQHNRLAVPDWQFEQRSAQCGGVPLHRNIDQRIRLHRQVAGGLCFIAWQRLHRTLAPPSPDVIASDPEQPRQNA